MKLTEELLELLTNNRHQIIDDFKLYLENYPGIIKHKPFLYSQKGTTNVFLFRYAAYKKNPYNNEMECIIGVLFHDNFDLKTIRITNSGYKGELLHKNYWTDFIECFPFVTEYNDNSIPFFSEYSNYIFIYELANRIIECNECVKSEESTNFINDLVLYFNNLFANYSSKLDGMKHKIETEIQNYDNESYGLEKIIDGDGDFFKVLKKNQAEIIKIDRDYIQKFVKIQKYLQTKKENMQTIFIEIKKSKSTVSQHDMLGLLKNQVNTYEILVFHSINMLGSLLSDDLITFYEIYESFDKLGIFNSSWENEVSEKLTNIGDKLNDLMYSIYIMEQNIVSNLNSLNYFMQEGFADLNISITNQLKEIDSSINTNNLLAGIQAYQLYKINTNTKSLRN
jgi:hypothetical protein